MLRKIEYLIPAALEAIDQVLLSAYQEGGIPKGYQGAISGFGASLLQMGLLPTLAVYNDEDHSADIDRKKLLKVLQLILKHKDSHFSKKEKLGLKETMLKDALQPEFPQDELKKHLIQASLAFKLAIRTYKLKG
jgi:CRISPR-associated protein Cmr5